MRIWILSLLLITSCASQTTKAPDWAIAELPAREIATPDLLPTLCEMVVVNDAINWSAACWAKLVEYEIVSKANYTIANSNASALGKTEGAYNSLQQAGAIQAQITEYYMSELKSEKQGRFIDGLFYKVLIGIGLVVLP